MTAPVIETGELTRRFGDLTAVDNLSLAIAPGAIFGMLGHNGAGKTTTVRLLNGVLSPNSGSARVLGMDPTVDGPAIRQRTGVLTENPALDDRLTGRTNLTLYAQIFGVPRSELDARVDALLARFELTDRADDKVGGYSKGMRQRLALARTLIHEPEVIFLDEPTAGLDPAVTREVHELILRLSREEQRTIFLCTHNLVEAQRLCTEVAVLARGRLLALGSPRSLGRQYALRQRVTLQAPPEQAARLMAVAEQMTDAEASADESAPGRVLVQGIEEAAIPDLVRRLVAHEVDIQAVIPAEPTLEDVYFALQEEVLP
jgi:ABC-2 type transport system ATP-binding protein